MAKQSSRRDCRPPISHQHLCRFSSSYGLPDIVDSGRWWSRRAGVEIDLVAKLSDGSHLFGEAKWSASPVGLRDLHRLHAKVESVPHPAWKANARYALFSAGGFDQLLIEAARQERVVLVGPEELFPGLGLRSGVQ